MIESSRFPKSVSKPIVHRRASSLLTRVVNPNDLTWLKIAHDVYYALVTHSSLVCVFFWVWQPSRPRERLPRWTNAQKHMSEWNDTKKNSGPTTVSNYPFFEFQQRHPCPYSQEAKHERPFPNSSWPIRRSRPDQPRTSESHPLHRSPWPCRPGW